METVSRVLPVPIPIPISSTKSTTMLPDSVTTQPTIPDTTPPSVSTDPISQKKSMWTWYIIGIVIILVLLYIFYSKETNNYIQCVLFSKDDDVYIQDFTRGVQEACKDLKLTCKTIIVPTNDISYIDALRSCNTSYPIIARSDPRTISKLSNEPTVLIKSTTPLSTLSISYRYTDMYAMFVKKINDIQTQNNLCLVVQDEDEDPVIQIEQPTIRTTKTNILSDLASYSMGDVKNAVKAVVIMNPNLINKDISYKLKQSFPCCSLMCVNYKDDNVDVNVYQDGKEQGYLSVLLTQTSQQRKTFDTKIFVI